METWHYTFVNPKTGKGWTDEEEKVIAGFTANGCGRMAAIRRLRTGQTKGAITVASALPTLVSFSDSTPAVDSPAWSVFVQVLAKFPGLTVEEARDKANALIQESAGRRSFAMPKVLSDAEKVEHSERRPAVTAEASPAKVKPCLVNVSHSGPVKESQTTVEPVRGRQSFKPARQPIAESLKHSILEKQGRKCIYCARKLGAEVWDVNGKLIILSTRFDHFEPFALRFNDDPKNLFAACKICNEIKSDHVFDSLKECRILARRRMEIQRLSRPVSRRYPIQSKPATVLAELKSFTN